MIKPLLFSCALAITLSACSSAVKDYSKPNNLLFQKKEIGTHTIFVERDSKLCSEDTLNKQKCFTSFYIDDFKAGDFYINNQAQYQLKENEYVLKVKNCNKECATTEFKYLVNDQLSNRKLILSVDDNGLPFIIQAGISTIAPAPVEAPITALSIPVPTPVEETSEINLGADTLFKFDRSGLEDLLTEGRLELDDIAQKINSQYVSVRTIHLVGHTDRLGSDNYNYALAERRAETVRNYLVQSGIPAEVISTASAGETQPVTQGCFGVQPRNVLHACLQPDRRVVVKITGVKKL